MHDLQVCLSWCMQSNRRTAAVPARSAGKLLACHVARVRHSSPPAAASSACDVGRSVSRLLLDLVAAAAPATAVSLSPAYWIPGLSSSWPGFRLIATLSYPDCRRLG
jgi:hypothetical protein